MVSADTINTHLHDQTGRMRFSTLKDLPEGALLAVYGSGGAGRNLVNRLQTVRPDVSVRFFLDSFRDGVVDGVPVKRLADVGKTDLESVTVVVVSHAWDHIEEALKGAGVTDYLVLDHRGGFRDTMVLPECRGIYINIPKAASSSIIHALRAAQNMPDQDDWKSASLTRVNLHDPIYEDFFVFTFVRHPLDRIVSFYRSVFLDPDPDGERLRNLLHPLRAAMKNDNISFGDFIEYVCADSDEYANAHWVSQHVFVDDSLGEPLADFVGRIENMEADITTVGRKLGCQLEIPHMNKGGFRDSDYRQYFLEEQARCVSQRYAYDIARFGYAP